MIAAERGQSCGNRQKHMVATDITEQAVDLVEAVQIDDQQRGCLAVLEIPQQTDTVRETGKVVGIGRLQFTNQLDNPVQQIQAQDQHRRDGTDQNPVIGALHRQQHCIDLISRNAGPVHHAPSGGGIVKLIVFIAR